MQDEVRILNVFAKRGRLATLLGVISLSTGLCVAADAPVKSSSSASKAQSVSHSSLHHKAKKGRRSRVRGQKAIDGSRVREIQQALIREHYLKRSPTGKWDDSTQAAMRRYQAQQGWQTKTVPDSRALIRLGLGPDHEHLLNPESAMTTEAHIGDPTRAHAASLPSSGSPGSASAVRSMPASSGSDPTAMPGNPAQ